jgi:hypothetical protein
MSAISKLEESVDLETLKTKIIKLKLDSFDMMREYERMNPPTLEACGHKSLPDAILWELRHTIKEIEKLNVAFLRKYPD